MTEENKNQDMIAKLKEEIRSELSADYTEKLEKMITAQNAPSTRSKDDEKKEEVRSAFVKLIRDSRNAEEYRALTGGTENGKWGVPVDWQDGIVAELPNENDFRQIADVASTASDRPVFVKADSVVSAWGAGTPTKQEMNGSQFYADVKDLKTLVALPVNLVNDTAYDILSALRQFAAEGIGEEELKAMTATSKVNSFNSGGSASDVVEGVVDTVVTAGNVETSTQDGGLGADDEAIIALLNKVIYSIKKRDRRGASFMMSSATQGVIANVHYKNGGPIMRDGKLLGYNVVTNDEMDDAVNTTAGTSQYPIIFGNFKQYAIRDRQNINLEILDQPYRAGGEIGYLFETRLATKVKRASAFKVIEVAKA